MKKKTIEEQLLRREHNKKVSAKKKQKKLIKKQIEELVFANKVLKKKIKASKNKIKHKGDYLSLYDIDTYTLFLTKNILTIEELQKQLGGNNNG